jgi:hypothetical protein
MQIDFSLEQSTNAETPIRFTREPSSNPIVATFESAKQ